MISDDPYGQQYHIPRQALLISQLQTLDQENRELLRQIGDYNRALSSYLKGLDDKINLLANYIVSDDQSLTHREPVTLSEGGLSFYSATPFEPGTYVHLIMILFPSFTTIAVIGYVRTSDLIDDQPRINRIGLEFTVLLEQDRKQLVRHIRRCESQQIREQPQKSPENY